MQKTTKKKIAPIVVTILVIAYMVPLIVFALYAMGVWRQWDGAAVMLPLLCYLIIGGAVIVGVILALRQRLQEIDGGEEEDASKY